ncbi:calcium homeostasis modulator protein 6-like [Eublepharis macularius]|uniref:Calcium homeostasis modulator protein 6-like n=1 Tax=Eublepharis macularius TaxID=481883 RepID=A0AA97L6A1_EUBMA|nr:calcium homeostasis modulator protein 6-like [Eublepharis macularius]
MMEKFRTVIDFCLSHQKLLGYGAVSLLTAGSERIFSVVVFKCPCNSWNLLYGSVFMLVPALILFLLGLLLSTRSWRVLTGCCAPGRLSRAGHRGRICRYLRILWLVVIGAAVAPLTWIAVALLGGHFYECAASGNTIVQRYMCQGEGSQCLKELPQVPCGDGSSQKVQDSLMSLRAQSQVMGWILISTVTILALISTCISRCRSPVSVLHLAFWKMYMAKEQELFEIKAKEHAAKLAERNLKCFFDSTELKPFLTPGTQSWQAISSLFAFNPEEHYYSMIHKYVSSKNKNSSIRSAEGDTFPACLGFVDAAVVTETKVF